MFYQTKINGAPKRPLPPQKTFKYTQNILKILSKTLILKIFIGASSAPPRPRRLRTPPPFVTALLVVDFSPFSCNFYSFTKTFAE